MYQPYLCPACKPLLPTTYRSRHSPIYSHYYSKHHRGPRLDLTNDSFAVLLTLLTRLALFLSSRNTHLSSRRTFHAPQLELIISNPPQCILFAVKILHKLLFSIAHGNMLTSQGNRKHYDQTPLIRTLRGS